MTFYATKLVREDFPDSMPPEVVDRILEEQEKRDRVSWVTIIGYGSVTAAAIGTMIMGYSFGWPYWTPGAAMAGMGLMSIAINRISARNIHRALVDQRVACPNCHAPLCTDTWSVRKQQAQRDAFLSGHCLNCHHRIEHVASALLRSDGGAVSPD